jgi:NTP pyrophosphatase (non-canonical NTP hydrolase)
MRFDEYQEEAKKTAIYPDQYRVVYPALGLAGEAGEVAEKVKKHIRDGVLNVEELKKELGDVLWYLAAIASDLDLTLDDVAEANLQKLRSRHARGVISGNGDNR